MNRGDLKTLGKLWVNERGATFWTDTQLNTLADFANRMVHRSIVGSTADGHTHFMQHSRFTFPAETRVVDLTGASYLNDTPYRVHEVAELPEDADPGAGSDAVPLEQKQPGDQTKPKSYWFNINGLYSTRRPHWFLEGNSLGLDPVPPNEIYLWVGWIDHIDAMTLDADSLLGGKALQWHDLVAGVFTRLMQQKERGEGYAEKELLQWIEQQIRQSEHARTRGVRSGYQDPYG